jgi:hypothetical protein
LPTRAITKHPESSGVHWGGHRFGINAERKGCMVDVGLCIMADESFKEFALDPLSALSKVQKS